ncbi:MAG: hypothetical protein WD851_10210 [Pirellulales bacterium]
MMTATDYIAFLESMGVTLKVKGDRLQVSPSRLVGPGTLEILKQYKAEIIAAIEEQTSNSQLNPLRI